MASRRATWALAVAVLMNNCPAISPLDRPRPTSVSTSRSRPVMPSMPGRRGAGADVAANWPMRRRVTPGASSASPAAITRIAARMSSRAMSLTRNPLAPARSAAYT